jgi:multisubunit Na+/H+ antiporter MnhE subunit
MKRAAAWLLFLWVALTGEASIINITLGLLLSVSLLVFFRPEFAASRTGTFRPWHAIRYFAFFVLKFLQANMQVALAVIRPARVLHKRGIIAVPIAASSEITTWLLALSVSLTPGTFILELRTDPSVMYVHLLQMESVRGARLEILELERMIVQAFGPPGATGRIDELMARVAAEPGDSS